MKTVTLEIPADEAAQFRALVKDLVTKMDRARRRMKRDQAAIERLKVKTRATLDELKALR
jgi:hypothetical protein